MEPTVTLEVTGDLNGVPVVDMDPFDLEYLKRPQSAWEDLRNVGPVAWLSKYSHYVLSRYDEVKAAQNDWRTFTTTGGAGMSDIRKPDNYRPASVIVEVDPPKHTDVRKAVNKVISPPVVRGWREHFEADAEEMIGNLLQRGRFDGVRDVSEPYVLKVFPWSIGLELNREQAVAVGDLNFNGLGPKNSELLAKAREKVAPFLEWWHQSIKGETVKPGGAGELLFKLEANGEIPIGLAGGLVQTFLRGGLDTTISSIGSGLWLFAANPEQWQLLRSKPELLRGAFDEVLRMETPIQTNFRTTTGPTQVGGLPLEPNQKVQLLLGSANRDPRRWSDPGKFDIARDATAHVAFGNGIHACAGQLIARLEFDCVMKALMKRVASIELDGEPEHRLNNALRTLSKLPLKVTLDA
jgi:cytochrome P450